ncbi:hypothetical protein pb186bvf_020978, partial [Paramecium bursaria]
MIIVIYQSQRNIFVEAQRQTISQQKSQIFNLIFNKNQLLSIIIIVQYQ